MFDFAYPIHLYLLAAVPVFVLLFMAARSSRRTKIKRLGRPDIVARMMPDASRYTPGVRLVLQMLALAAIVIVLARPRTEGQMHHETSAGIEIMIAFDLSNSMNAPATDRTDGPTRLARAKVLLERLIDRLENDKVGLVIFAGDAKTQLPLTPDSYTAKMYISELEPAMMGYQGTNIADAINMARRGFSGADDMQRAIILITDAEDHEGEALDAARAAAAEGIQVDVVGVGTSTGAVVPGITDRDGNPARSALNVELAEQIAAAGNGIYVNAATGSALGDLSRKLDELGKSEFSTVRYPASAEQFPTFAVIALVFLIIDTFVVDRKISWLRGIDFFTRQSAKTSGKEKGK